MVDKSYGNDACPSFYFVVGDSYFVLWVEHADKTLREEPNSSRYTLVHGVNVGSNDSPEIYDDHGKDVILETDCIKQLKQIVQKIVISK